MSHDETEPIRVLHVDDDPDLAEVVALHLQRVHEAIIVETAGSASDGLDCLEGEAIDCVVSDLEMPGMDGLEFLRAVRERHGDLPFILFTGKGSEEVASEAISAGVTEYLQKGTSGEQYEVLAHRIDHAVTERRARAALQESERMFSTLVENLPGMVYRCRTAEGWPMEFVSEGCEDLTGYAPETIESGEVSWGEDVIHPADQEEVWEPVEPALEAGESFTLTYRIVTAAGETRWAWERGSPVYDDSGDPTYLEGFIADVTSQHRRREALKEAKAVTEHALDALEDAFYVVDHETGELLRWNDSVREFTGYTDDELDGMTVFDLVPEDQIEDVLAAGERILEGAEGTLEIDIQCKNGEHFPVEIRSATIRGEDDEPIGIGNIARDVTENRRREERLEKFASVVSHDLRGPLHVVRGRVELARETGDVDHLEPVAAAVDRMDDMIDGLLTLSLHGETVGETETVDLATLAREAWETMQTADATLQLDEPGTVEADPDRLRDVFANLFRNAIEHGRDGARSLTLEEAVDRASAAGGDGSDDASEATVRVRVGGTEDGFFVADDGPGIAPDERETVFEYGYSTATGGTGLGLSIVERVAGAHGWTVVVTDSQWGGARFEVDT